MSVISGVWEEGAEKLDQRGGRMRAHICAEQDAQIKVEDAIGQAVALLYKHRLGLICYFKEVIECSQLPELEVEDFVEDILLHIWQSDLSFDWNNCTFDDLLQVGRGMIVDKLLPKLRVSYAHYFEADRKGEESLDSLMSKARGGFMALQLDPYLEADWLTILHSEAERVFRREFYYYASRNNNAGVMQVSGGKVKKLCEDMATRQIQQGEKALCSTQKVDAILKALRAGQGHQEFRHCIYQQILSFYQKFPDIWHVISLRIWEPISTKEAAFLKGMKEGAYREHCSARLSGMLEHLRVSAPLLKENEHE